MGALSLDHSLSPVPQGLLDLDSKERSNLFPWRGQFSPELVEILLKTYGKDGETVFDPFAGVGTTLFEAAKLNMRGRGTELNPSAFLMAQSVEWVRYSLRDREEFISVARAALEKVLPAQALTNPFLPVDTFQEARDVANAALETGYSNEVKHILANTLIRGLGNDNNFLKAFHQHISILLNLPFLSAAQRVFQADARRTPLAPESVDLVLTSPPYINVFNYHENNRKAMELLGWDILSVAKAEVGSNRKNRGNRFLTVIQYCLDMLDVLLELKRVLKETGNAIFIVGKESMVRGIPFENGELVSSLAPLSGFRVVMRQSRRFSNRFGQSIFEDILHLVPAASDATPDPRSIAVQMLKQKTGRTMPADVRADLEAAITGARDVSPSPIYSIY